MMLGDRRYMKLVAGQCQQDKADHVAKSNRTGSSRCTCSHTAKSIINMLVPLRGPMMFLLKETYHFGFI
jgi:hypothetical protein